MSLWPSSSLHQEHRIIIETTTTIDLIHIIVIIVVMCIPCIVIVIITINTVSSLSAEYNVEGLSFSPHLTKIYCIECSSALFCIILHLTLLIPNLPLLSWCPHTWTYWLPSHYFQFLWWYLMELFFLLIIIITFVFQLFRRRCLFCLYVEMTSLMWKYSGIKKKKIRWWNVGKGWGAETTWYNVRCWPDLLLQTF